MRRATPPSFTALPGNFNPRTPCGVRPVYLDFGLEDINISIHAPLAGCDGAKMDGGSNGEYFNPRTPCGVRQRRPPARSKSGSFQSTHPLRGATLHRAASRRADGISIHAPLAGCDSGVGFDEVGPLISIHAPLAGCDHDAGYAPCRDRQISIHAPLAGCDAVFPHDASRAQISIHAPLAGCDLQARNDREYEPISIHAPLAGCD